MRCYNQPMAELRCPYCGEAIEIWVDEGGEPHQSYVEDCSLCCRPLQVDAVRDDRGEYVVTVEKAG